MAQAPKRHREGTSEEYGSFPRAAKRQRSTPPDRLSQLSNELLLRTLSFLPTKDLLLCERLSKRIRLLASDSQLWKALFYDRFVRPRAVRIPGIRDASRSEGSLFYASRKSKWLQDEHLVRDGQATDWKRHYKLRHNWSQGVARVKEAQIADTEPIPPMLVRIKGNHVIIADATQGLQVRSLAGDAGIRARAMLSAATPTSLAVDSSDDRLDLIHISVGFLDGSFSVYTFLSRDDFLRLAFTHPASTRAPASSRALNRSISAIAFTSPYLITLDSESVFSLYKLNTTPSALEDQQWKLPLLISSMKSHIASAPLALSMRPSSSGFLASIAYPMSSWRRRWSIGLQEFRIATDGTMIESRSASTDLTPPVKMSDSLETSIEDSRDHDVTSISYSHPYILTSHRDNTLTMQLVTSNDRELKFGPEQRLWGHTTAVSGAYISNRGKAVSVSSHGDDLRVWNLEGWSHGHRNLPIGQASIRIQRRNSFPTNADRRPSASCGYHEIWKGKASGWLAFDEEKVVLLHGTVDGPQALVTYDFT